MRAAHLGLAIGDHLDTEHQPLAAHVADDVVLGLHLLQALDQVRTHDLAVLLPLLLV